MYGHKLQVYWNGPSTYPLLYKYNGMIFLFTNLGLSPYSLTFKKSPNTSKDNYPTYISHTSLL